MRKSLAFFTILSLSFALIVCALTASSVGPMHDQMAGHAHVSHAFSLSLAILPFIAAFIGIVWLYICTVYFILPAILGGAISTQNENPPNEVSHWIAHNLRSPPWN